MTLRETSSWDAEPAEVLEPALMRDSYASTAIAEIVDRSLHSATARFTAGLSPIALTGAWLDWATHLAVSPGKHAQLVQKGFKKWLRLAAYASRSHDPVEARSGIEPLPQDRRFANAAWRLWPYNLIQQEIGRASCRERV